MMLPLNSKIVLIHPTVISLKRSTFIQSRTLVDLPIEWKRPTKVPWYDPKKTGDGVLKLEVDMNKTPTLAERSKELETANEYVKSLFTFHFLGRAYAMNRARQEMVDLVKDHKYDNRSLACQIAFKTATVRNLMEHFHKFPHDRKPKIALKEVIESRNRKLRYLREYDYKKFEWILDKLDLYYKPKPEVLDKVERKKSIRYLTERYCTEFKERKLDEYKAVLESQKLEFFKNKIATLEWIRKEELECETEPTVTESDIESAKNQLSNYIKSVSTQEIQKGDNILQDI
ncbi:small ribosomal subunit protein uS15m [Planococcus citri]|uniref:small ribosomal subunit protein uS15m n=1 Tax=Planococcus citri TaxID=170843 RepID=UPI0031F8D7CA